MQAMGTMRCILTVITAPPLAHRGAVQMVLARQYAQFLADGRGGARVLMQVHIHRGPVSGQSVETSRWPLLSRGTSLPCPALPWLRMPYNFVSVYNQTGLDIKPIRNEDDLRAAFGRLEAIFQAAPGSPEADERDVLVTLVEAYENQHWPIGPADPVEAIKFRMEQQGLVAKDLEAFIGPSGRVSEVLNRKRRLSPRMVQRLHQGLRIPYESLLSRED